MTNRFERQEDLVPHHRLDRLTASIIGAGAIGRQVALQLASIGVRQMQLVDFDFVEPTNITTQGFLANDVDQLKVSAVCQAVTAIDPTIVVEQVANRFRAKEEVGEAVFCCVDSISARALVWRSVHRRCAFWADGRMLGDVIRVLAAVNSDDKVHYSRTLFPQQEAMTGRCTSHGTIYAASIAAGLLVHQFTRWLRGIRVDPDTTLSLLANELTPALAEDSRVVAPSYA
jgi:hypothetical protein